MAAILNINERYVMNAHYFSKQSHLTKYGKSLHNFDVFAIFEHLYCKMVANQTLDSKNTILQSLRTNSSGVFFRMF